MNPESKLEQAAFELAQALKIIIGDIKSKPNDTRYLSSLKVGANALLKYDEVRQSLTTPAGNEVTIDWLNKLQPDYNSKQSYQHGFHDAIECIKKRVESLAASKPHTVERPK